MGVETSGQGKDLSSLGQLQSQDQPAVRAESVQGEAIFSNQDGKLMVFLVVWIAFAHSVQTAQNKAQVQQEEARQVSNIQQDLITQLSGINFVQLPESQAHTSSPNMGLITVTNNDNQRIQAHINIVQDKVGQVQQIQQVTMSQISTTVQSVSQTLNENFAIAQLMIELTKDIAS